MNCPTCQLEIQDGSQFCQRCGTRFAPQQGSYPPPQYGQPQGSYPPPQGYPQQQGYQQQGYQGGNPGHTIDVTIEHGSSFALAIVRLQPEQAIQAESGAMVSMTPNVELQSGMKGGIMGALKRAVVGESVFISTFTARGGPGEVCLAPPAPGDVTALNLSGQGFLIQSSSFLAASPSINVDTKFGGARSFFSGEGLFLIHASGAGTLLLSSFGAIRKKTLRPGEQYVVDTGHIVAFEASVQYQLQKAAKGIFRTMTSGEGLVAVYTGPGDIYIQTRNLEAFAGLLKSFFPSQGSSGQAISKYRARRTDVSPRSTRRRRRRRRRKRPPPGRV